MIMPVSGNHEPGLLSRPTSICSSGIPIKKRRFPFVPPPSPPREAAPATFSEMHDAENGQKSTSDELAVVADRSEDSVQKSDEKKNSLEEVKKDIVSDVKASSSRTDVCREPQTSGGCQGLEAPGSFPPTPLDVENKVPIVLRVNSAQSNADLGKSQDEEVSPAVISDSVDKVNNFSSLVSEISTGHAVPESNLRLPIVNVKTEMVNNRSEGDELSTALGDTKLCLKSNALGDSSLEIQKVDLSNNIPNKVVPPLLSLSLSKRELLENVGANKTVTDCNEIISSTHRSNWDLNTTMDAWEEGYTEETASHGATGADELSSSLLTHETKHLLSSTSGVDVRLDKGKGVMEPFEERSTPFIQFNVEDSLLLSLSTCSKQDSSRVMPHFSLQRPTINSISSGSRTVKAEPVDDNLKPDLSLVPGGTMQSSNNGMFNKISAESYDKTLVGNFHKIIEPTSFKSEVSHNSNQASQIAASFTLKQPSSNIEQLQGRCSSSCTVVSREATPQQYYVSKLSTLSELSGSAGVLDQSEHFSNSSGIYIKDNMNFSTTSQMPQLGNKHSEGHNVCDDAKFDSSEAINSSLQRSDENNIKPKSITEESASDRVKISAMVEDHSFGFDYNSDGNHDVSQMGRDDGQCEKLDDDYEDGEVRDFSVKSMVRDPTSEGMLSENRKEDHDGCEMGVPTDKSTINENHMDIQFHDGSNNHNEPIEAMSNVNDNQVVSDYVGLRVTKSEQVASVETEENVPEKLLDNLSVGENIPDVKQNELMGDGDTKTKDIVIANVSVTRNENEKGSCEAGMNDKGHYVVGVPDSSLTKEEVTVNEQDSFKDSVARSNRSRIINLPRASYSPSGIKSLSGRAFASWSGRERYGDADGDNLHFRGNRAEAYGDDSRKFSRDRSFRNSRMDFKRDRGRGTGRFDSIHNKWDPGHDFPPKSFDVSANYRFNRHRRTSAVADNALRSDDYVVAPGTGSSAGRIGRKPLTEEFHSFRQPSSRRLSPGYRDGATIRSFPSSRRLPESDSDLPELRHEKFVRGPDDITTRPQASYDEMGGQFVNGNQDYSSVQRRFFPHARSKSPGSTQPRSPGTWPSSRRRFNDDFNNPSDQIQHRSLMYREERMRSPDRVCYTDELGDRRRVAPNYTNHRAKEMRDMDFTREQGNLRSISSTRRSPSERVFPRSTRRLDVFDSRERTESDEYFSGPINSGRFHEFRSDGSNDERRKFGERRGQLRPSRPSYGGGNENFLLNGEDGSMPHRFSADQDTESFERSNVKQRGFDGPVRTRPLIAQRQIRSTEDQEGSFGQSGQVWHDESLSDGSRIKKRRF